MKHRSSLTLAGLAALAALAVLTGCSNPADNVPEARVGDAVPAATAPAAPAETTPAATPALTPDAVTTNPTTVLTTATQTMAGEAHHLMLDPASKIAWVGSKVTGKHDGGFTTFTGEVHYVPGDPAGSHVKVTIDMHSIFSDTEKLTGHLKSPDFFDVEKFPTAEFSSTSIVPTPAGYDVTGNLTLKGTTKSITFPATISEENGGITAKAEFFIKRFDFGIVYPGKADDLIRDEVVIKFDLAAHPAH